MWSCRSSSRCTAGPTTYGIGELTFSTVCSPFLLWAVRTERCCSDRFHEYPIGFARSIRSGRRASRRQPTWIVSGLSAMVCVPVGTGVLELGSTDILEHG